jgi:hypothetical protein
MRRRRTWPRCRWRGALRIGVLGRSAWLCAGQRECEHRHRVRSRPERHAQSVDRDTWPDRRAQDREAAPRADSASLRPEGAGHPAGRRLGASTRRLSGRRENPGHTWAGIGAPGVPDADPAATAGPRRPGCFSRDVTVRPTSIAFRVGRTTARSIRCRSHAGRYGHGDDCERHAGPEHRRAAGRAPIGLPGAVTPGRQPQLD